MSVHLENCNTIEKNEPFFSIVIPVYNTEKYLQRCLDSVVNQTFKDIEIIIVNDCSPKNCDEIVNNYKDNRIKYIKHETNKGTLAARKTGSIKANGKYITYLDSDDELILNAFEVIYNNIDKDYDVLHFSVKSISQNPNKKERIKEEKFTSWYLSSKRNYSSRGEGARLYNLAGERFMVGAHELAELAPRDVVAQKIDQQIRKEGKGYVYLSLKHLDPQYIIKRFPTIYAKCKELGIDFTDRIPIAPAAHYTVGGIRTDEYGRTGIENLYICGELASTGIMGANRLASNSLIECLVFGKRAVSDSLKNKGRNQFGKYAPKLFIDKSLEQLYLDTANRIASIVTECAGIVRNADLLKKGLADLENIKRETESITGSKEGYADEIYSNRIRHLITTATLIMNGALFREESRGCHFRSDYPCEREEFHCHTIQKKGSAISRTEVSAE